MLRTSHSNRSLQNKLLLFTRVKIFTVQEYIVLVGQNLKDHAISILENLFTEIEIGFYQVGGYDQTVLDDVQRSIDEFVLRILDTDISPNSEFTEMAEFAAELVYFSYHHPEEFSEMFAESAVKWNHDIDVRTAPGICHLLTFFQCIRDDHDYCLDPASKEPLLKLMDQVQLPVRSFGPNTLLFAMQHYRSTLINKPTSEDRLSKSGL
jgi:hypothetical protein